MGLLLAGRAHLYLASMTVDALRRTRLLVLASIVGATLTVSHSARADFASDIASIVEQLIEDNVATEVVPNMAANFPVTCDLLPSSIRALQSKRYNGFMAVVRNELADTSGLLVLLAVDGGNGKLLPTPAQTFEQQTDNVLNAVFKPIKTGFVTGLTVSSGALAGCTFDTKAKTPPQAPTQSVATTILQQCTSTQSSAQQELACAAGIAVRDAASGSTSNLSPDAERALVAVAAQILMDDPGLKSALANPPIGIKAYTDAVADVRKAVGSPSTAVFMCSGAAAGPAAQACNAANALVQTLAAELATLSGTSSASLAQVITTIGAFAAQSTTLAAPVATLGQIADVAAGKALSFVSDIQAKNYGAAAGDAFVAANEVIDNVCQSQPGNEICSRLGQDVREFVRATAIYAIDSAANGAASASVSQDFRDAAVDLIEDTGGAGVRRRTFAFYEHGSSQMPAFVFPNFALRGSLRPGFAALSSTGTSSSAFMFYPSIDWPNIRWKFYPCHRKENALWWGGDFSLLDVAGPFVEIAGRNSTLNGSTSVGTVFGLAFLAPRLETEFAVPELTKNLVIGLGAAVRFYRADQTPAAVAGAPVVATYCTAGQSGCQNGSFTVNNFEGSIFVKYVP